MSRLLAATIALTVVLLFCAMSWFAFMHSRNVVVADLEDRGYRNVELSVAFINRAPMQCSGKSTSIYTYTAERNGKPVDGFACNRGWPWGVAHWDN